MSAVALITDLFFFSKVKGTADVLGVPLTVVRNEAALLAAVEAGASLVIIDANASGIDPAEAVRRCKERAAPPRVLAYHSHVQVELADALHAAGADLVLPRSRFSAELPELLRT
jgi:DNA-binding NarL/FixJ family response regulator